jgi:hypothetical protein
MVIIKRAGKIDHHLNLRFWDRVVIQTEVSQLGNLTVVYWVEELVDHRRLDEAFGEGRVYDRALGPTTTTHMKQPEGEDRSIGRSRDL